MSAKLQSFLQDQSYPIESKDFTSLRCIDDRYCEEHDPHHYAVPGAGLGIKADILAGFEATVKRPATENELQFLWDMAVKHVGSTTFHTAHAHVRDDISSPVLGCGYLVATLEAEAHISPTAAAFLKSKATEHAESGYEATSFDVGHNASFVLFVMNEDVGIIPTHKDGTRAYVFHVPVHKKLITRIIQDISDHFDAISAETETFIDATFAEFNKRLGVVAESLKLDQFPHYEVYSRDEIKLIYEPIQEEIEHNK